MINNNKRNNTGYTKPYSTSFNGKKTPQNNSKRILSYNMLNVRIRYLGIKTGLWTLVNPGIYGSG